MTDADLRRTRQTIRASIALAEIATLLVEPDFDQDELSVVREHLMYIDHNLMEIDPAVVASARKIARAVALRAASIGEATDVKHSEARAFGNGAHIILPASLIGQHIYWMPAPATDADLDTLLIDTPRG